MRIFLTLLLALTGCASRERVGVETPKETSLAAGAELVELVSFVSEERLLDYEEVKVVECRLGLNYGGADANVAACENFLRNEAYQSGATIAWVRPEWRRVGRGPACANCVEMRASLLAPRQSRARRAMKR